MSKNKTTKKKVVVTTQKKKGSQQQENTNQPKAKVTTKTVRKQRNTTATKTELTFGRENYILMAIGFLMIMVGIGLMSGGDMPNPDVWDESIIYSFRRTVLAPFIILGGLVVEIFAIFRNYKI